MKKNLIHRLTHGCMLIVSVAALADCSGSGGSANTYTIGGIVQGLSGSGLVLANGSDTLTVPANTTSFTMPRAVADGTAYDVTVQTHPTAVSCTINSGAGTVTGANVTGISVSCAPGSGSVIYSFNGPPTDGLGPFGSLFEGSDGDFYGVTNHGGANDDGTVFKMTPGGTETLLYSFQGGTSDGAYPIGGPIEASDGNLYGTTGAGGASGNGIVFQITPGGTETVLYSFQGGTSDGANPVRSLIQAGDGNFYGMTHQGGTNDVGVIFKITSDGTESVLHSFQNTPTDGDYPLGSLIQASDGNFYGVTEAGGATGDGVVFKVTAGGTETVLYSFQGGPTDGANPSAGLIQASDGTLYGMTESGGASNDGTVFEFN